MKFKWELLDHMDDLDENQMTHRAKVFGGWVLLYTHTEDNSADMKIEVMSNTMTFIPDAKHEWEIEEEEEEEEIEGEEE